MFNPVIFLDIDGVFNSHTKLAAAGICGIDPMNVDELNYLIGKSGADLVISSAWRYMILNGAMTLDGFRYMLMTHGLTSKAQILGITQSDEAIPERGRQISEWLRVHGNRSYIILDDGADDSQPNGASTLTETLRSHGARWVKVDGERGLTRFDVERALFYLTHEMGAYTERCGLCSAFIGNDFIEADGCNLCRNCYRQVIGEAEEA